jgi:NAD(P)H-dependent FMN reductase
MPIIGNIPGSTRPSRNGEAVAQWALQVASSRTGAESEPVDLAHLDLPLLDEGMPPVICQYSRPHTKAWSAKIGALDGFVFVTLEYNRSTSDALKNAIDFLYAEWTNKAAGFIVYGLLGGTRAVEHLRLIMGELQVADVRDQVALCLLTDFTNYRDFTPQPTLRRRPNDPPGLEHPHHGNCGAPRTSSMHRRRRPARGPQAAR